MKALLTRYSGNAPSAKTLTIDLIEEIAAQTPVCKSYKWLFDFKYSQVAPEDNLREVPQRAIEQAHRLFRAIGPACIPGFAMSTEFIKDQVLWYKMLCPSSMRAHSYTVVVGMHFVVSENNDHIAQDHITSTTTFDEIIGAHCRCQGSARRHCPHILCLLDVIASIHDRVKGIFDMKRQLEESQETNVPCTSKACSWLVGSTEGVKSDVLLPIHRHIYMKHHVSELAAPVTSIWGARRNNFHKFDFSPFREDTKNILAQKRPRDHEIFSKALNSLAKTARLEAWADRETWNGSIVRNGSQIIGERHKKAQRCKLGLDFFLGESDGEEYPYWDVEGFEKPADIALRHV